MVIEQIFHQLLQLGEAWSVGGVEYDEPSNTFKLFIHETEKLWPTVRCPKCSRGEITCYDHAPQRSWRHLDVFNKKSEIICAPPRGKCAPCDHVFRVPVPWEGEGKHFTKDFEAFALMLMREMPVKKASEIMGETDQRMWRVLFAHVDKAYAALDLSETVWIGADEMNCRKGHHYLTVFADLLKRRVIFATEGKDHTTFKAFVEALLKHNGHPKAITQAAIDMSPAYQKGVAQQLPNATIVFDKFHVVSQVNTAVDEVRRVEARDGDPGQKNQLKSCRWIFRKNPENLTAKEVARLDELDLRHLATGIAYQMRLVLQEAYKSRRMETARRRFQQWVEWVRSRAERVGRLLEPMVKAADMIERHLEGILAWWKQGLTTAYLEGLNSLFSATKRKARGFRSPQYMTTMLYFIAGKLTLPYTATH